MLLHPNESFSWRLIRCWYIQVFHVLVLRPSTSLTFALHLPLRLTHGTLQVITVRLNPLTGHNRQNHKNRPSRNPVGTQLRNIHVHTLRFLGFLCSTFGLSWLEEKHVCVSYLRFKKAKNTVFFLCFQWSPLTLFVTRRGNVCSVT